MDAFRAVMAWIVLGTLVGVVSYPLVRRACQRITVTVVTGILGALMGGYTLTLTGSYGVIPGLTILSWLNIASAFIGAVSLLVIVVVVRLRYQ